MKLGDNFASKQDRILYLIDAGYSRKDVAAKVGCDPAYVRTCLQRAKMVTPKAPRTQEWYEAKIDYHRRRVRELMADMRRDCGA